MIHKVLRQNAQEYGGFTDLFILGTFRRFDAATKTWLSDFTADVANVSSGAASVAQKFNLIQVTETLPATSTSQAALPRFIAGFPLCMVNVVFPFSDTADNPKLDVGVAASLTANTGIIAGTAGDLELQDRVVLPAAAAVPLAPNTVTQFLTATVTSAAANVNALVPKTGNPAGTGVDIWIYVTLLPYREWVQNRIA
jgi:hypothetical protein